MTDSDLSEAATCKEDLQLRQEGGRAVRRRIKFYNLDMILPSAKRKARRTITNDFIA